MGVRRIVSRRFRRREGGGGCLGVIRRLEGSSDFPLSLVLDWGVMVEGQRAIFFDTFSGNLRESDPARFVTFFGGC